MRNCILLLICFFMALNTNAIKATSGAIKSQYIDEGDTDISGLNNVVYVESMKCKSGIQINMPILMKNSAEIRGFQFDLYLPEGATIAVNKKGKMLVSLNPNRLDEGDEHSLLVTKQDDGSYRFLCNSMYEETFLGNEGEVATVTLEIGGEIEDGEYPIILKNIKLSENDIRKYYETEQIKSTLTIESFIRGDLNGDGNVNMSDVMFLVQKVLKGKFPDEE